MHSPSGCLVKHIIDPVRGIVNKQNRSVRQAKKLPSGSWRCQVCSHTEEIRQPDGTTKKKRIYKSFTFDDPSVKGRRKCEMDAAEWAAKKDQQKVSNYSMTFGEALDIYIIHRKSTVNTVLFK